MPCTVLAGRFVGPPPFRGGKEYSMNIVRKPSSLPVHVTRIAFQGHLKRLVTFRGAGESFVDSTCKPSSLRVDAAWSVFWRVFKRLITLRGRRTTIREPWIQAAFYLLCTPEPQSGVNLGAVSIARCRKGVSKSRRSKPSTA